MWITEGNWLLFCHTGKRKKDQLHSTTLPALQFAVVHFISYPLWKMATGYQVWCGLLFLCFFLAFTKPSKIPPLSTRATHFDPWWLATRLPGEARECTCEWDAHNFGFLYLFFSFLSFVFAVQPWKIALFVTASLYRAGWSKLSWIILYAVL